MVKALTPKQLDKAINPAFYAKCFGVQIPITAIPKIYRVAREAYQGALVLGPANAEAAMVASLLNVVEAVRL